VTLGERFTERSKAQDLSTHLGKIVRVNPDGTAPPDNPFVRTQGALPEIWSYGHRNVQGAALHPQTGALWTHEHGPQGGDEVNVVRAGRNYGWPVVRFGREYVTGTAIGEGTAKPGIEPPLWQWTPSIAPSGMAFCTTDRHSGWKGSLLVGAEVHAGRTPRARRRAGGARGAAADEHRPARARRARGARRDDLAADRRPRRATSEARAGVTGGRRSRRGAFSRA